MADEKEYNLFLRTSDPHLQSLMGVGTSDGDALGRRQETLARLRAAKDKFKYQL